MALKEYSNIYSIKYTNIAVLFLHISITPFLHGLFSLEFLIAFSFFLSSEGAKPMPYSLYPVFFSASNLLSQYLFRSFFLKPTELPL